MRSKCPLNYGLELFGDKWTLLIIRDLMFFEKRYYREFLQSDEGISTNILADRLVQLEKEGFINKLEDDHHKQKIVYSLTEKGIAMMPIIIEIGLWSDKYGEGLAEDRNELLGPFKKDKVKADLEWRKKLRKLHLKD
ncbi:MAG: helix-turn-helix transcriptional regulator [Saprospiraceae bacterium]|nr:helix-turn-helix transcriptional regulator [Saprospiraceae bacterium]